MIISIHQVRYTNSSTEIPEFPIPPEIAKTEHQAKIGSTNFTAVRTLSTIPGESYLYKIEVETNWDDAVEPVRLSLTKYDPAGPEP